MTEHKLKSWSNFSNIFYSSGQPIRHGTYNCTCGFSNTISAFTYSIMTMELKRVRLEHEAEMKCSLKDWYKIHRDSNACYTWNGYRWVSDEEALREANKVVDYGYMDSDKTGYIDNQIAIADQTYARNIERLLREKARIEALPKEPKPTDDGDNSILFKIRFSSSTPYYVYVATYVAAMGVWYVSGPTQKNNGGYTWDALVNWITNNPKWEIWYVSEYTHLASS